MIGPVLGEETPVAMFVKLTEEHRRERQRRVDAGDEKAMLKFKKTQTEREAQGSSHADGKNGRPQQSKGGGKNGKPHSSKGSGKSGSKGSGKKGGEKRKYEQPSYQSNKRPNIGKGYHGGKGWARRW